MQAGRRAGTARQTEAGEVGAHIQTSHVQNFN